MTAGDIEVVSRAELEQMEAARKEEAARAVAEIEAAESDGVLEAIELLFGNGTNSSLPPPGLLGQVAVLTTAGPMAVAALSIESLQGAGGNTVIFTNDGPRASVEVSSAILEQAPAAYSEPILLTITAISPELAASFRTDDVLAKGRRLAFALKSAAVSIKFRRADGAIIPMSGLEPPLKIVLDTEADAKCAFWDEEVAKWSPDRVRTLSSSNSTLACSTTHLSIFGGVVEAVLKLVSCLYAPHSSSPLTNPTALRRNVAIALQCSTFSALVAEAAFPRLLRSDWLQHAAASFSTLAL